VFEKIKGGLTKTGLQGYPTGEAGKTRGSKGGVRVFAGGGVEVLEVH